MKSLAFLQTIANAIFRRARVEAEMEEELRSHIRDRAADLERSGMAHEEAERRARIEFGGYEHVKEECRGSLGARFWEALVQDLRFGGRLLLKAPGFAAVTILTLALGIGANTAIFSVIYAVLLRPLPYTHPEELVVGFEDNLQRGIPISGCSYQDLTELQESGIFASIGGVNRHDLTITGSGSPALVKTVVVTPEVFPVLNAKPLLGRYFFSGDEKKGSAPVALVSEGLWRSRFGGDSTLVGKSIMLDQRAFTVVGIMPASFKVPVFSDHQEIWIPIVHDPLFSAWIPNRNQHWLRAVGRLNPGVTLARAKAEAGAVGQRMEKEFPAENGGWALRIAPMQAAIVEDVRTPLLILLGAVGLVLLLACVNIANLLLARTSSRTKEMALRQALGARRGRMIRQLLTESALLGLLGAALGLMLAYSGANALTALLPRDLPSMHNVQIDAPVLGFALLISLMATALFGLIPAFLTTDSNLQFNLKDNAAHSGSGSGRLRLRRFLAAAEIGVATILVVGAGLLMRSLLTMTSVNPGFTPANILKAEVSLPRYRYSSPQQWKTFAETLLERIQAQPGLKDSAFAVPVPLANGQIALNFTIADHAAPAAGTPTTADYVSVTPEYFQVMGIPLLHGRYFAREDSDHAHPIAIISESFARVYFKDENPIGKRLMFGFPPDSNVVREIVGVVGGVRNTELTQEPGPMMYVPFAQAPFWGGNLVVKSASPPATTVAAIRDIVRGLDNDLPVTDIVTMPEVLDASVAQPKFRTWLVSAFGAIALLLAAIGVFGVMSYSVASRTRELGVRAALGASQSSIVRMILLEGMKLGGVGLGFGLAGALGFSWFLKSQLYGVTAHDPMTLALSVGVLLAVAVLACYLPARRAMRVDPMIALRCE